MIAKYATLLLKHTLLPSAYLSLLFFGLVACEEKKEKIENLETIRDHAGEQRKKKPSTKEEDTLQAKVELYQQDSVGLDIQKLALIPDEKQAFLDRFTENSSFLRLTEKDTTNYYTQHAWYFLDSNKVKNAFFNWLDEEKHTKIGATSKLFNTPTLVFVTDKQILEITSNKKMDVLKWIQFVRFNYPKERFLFIIAQNKSKKNAWLEYKNHQIQLKKFTE